MRTSTFSQQFSRVRKARAASEWPCVQPLYQKLVVPASQFNPLEPLLSDDDAYELWLLRLEDKQWQEIEQQCMEDGRPLIDFDEEGNLLINDPVLAAIDAEARANARG